MSEAKKILVVEDELHLAKGLQFNLEREGYIVSLVDNGKFPDRGPVPYTIPIVSVFPSP